MGAENESFLTVLSGVNASDGATCAPCSFQVRSLNLFFHSEFCLSLPLVVGQFPPSYCAKLVGYMMVT